MFAAGARGGNLGDVATRLKNIVRFTGLAVGVPAQLPHNLNLSGVPLIPDRVIANEIAGFAVAADDTNVTVTRDSSDAPDNVDVLVQYWHSENRVFGPFGDYQPAALVPSPFVTPGGAAAAALKGQTEIIHAAIAPASQLRFTGASAPTPMQANNLLYLAYTLNTDRAFRIFKIGYDFVDTPSLH